MRILHGLIDLKGMFPRPILTIGNFDGVHLGHRAIFQQIIQRAQAIGGTSAMLTFDPHPLKVLRPDQAPPLITTFDEKIKLLDELGLQVAIILPFTLELSSMSAQQFIEEILLKRIGILEIHVGHDFAFGRGREGTIACLREMGTRLGFEVKTVEPVFLEGQVVSSSLIRRLIQQGEVQRVARLLGRPYSLKGTPMPVEGIHTHALLRSLCGQPMVQRQPSAGISACGEPFWMAECRHSLDPEMEMEGVSSVRLLPEKELLPSPGLYAIQILHRPGNPSVEADLPNLCHILSSQDTCPPQLYLWEVPDEVEGGSWEIAFHQRLKHWNEGIVMGCAEGNGGKMGLPGESHGEPILRGGGPRADRHYRK